MTLLKEVVEKVVSIDLSLFTGKEWALVLLTVFLTLVLLVRNATKY